ncbi:hypothetical protein H2248_001827 [Termitomyces sp. 'cryptogamus']|nr:hypothetical protein H2248_001827 [Termitomyces sp. 'cryptogamus']
MESTNLSASVLNPKIMNVIDYSTRCISCALDFVYTGTIDDTCTGDLDLMIELLKISDFWQMDRLHKETQRLIASKKLINIDTCREIEEIAQTYHESFLFQQCQEYREHNKRLM